MSASAKIADGRPGGVQGPRGIGGPWISFWDAERAASRRMGIFIQGRAEIRCAGAAGTTARPISHDGEKFSRLIDMTEVEFG